LTESEIAYAGKKLKPIIYNELVRVAELDTTNLVYNAPGSAALALLAESLEGPYVLTSVNHIIHPLSGYVSEIDTAVTRLPPPRGFFRPPLCASHRDRRCRNRRCRGFAR